MSDLGIYNQDFLNYLEDNLGDPHPIKHNIKDIVCCCPWCDVGTQTSKPHLWISKEAPIYHCFRAACNKSGFIGHLTKAISGNDKSDGFVDKEKITYYVIGITTNYPLFHSSNIQE